MKAICTNGLVIECENFKAIDGGVILTEDVKRKRPIGFVPTGTLRYVLPDEVADREDAAKASDVAAGAVNPTSDETREWPRSGETDVPSPAQRRTVARLRDRLDRIEAMVELSEADDTAGSSRSASESASDVTDDPTSETRATSGADTESDVLRVTGGDESNGDTESADSTADDAERESGTEDEPAGTVRDDEREDDAGTDDTDDPYPDLQRVDGLGPTYAGRLHDEGIETLADLKAADPEDVAAIADVGTSRAADWTTQAGELA